MPGGLFDWIIPDITGDGQADMIDSFLLNEMINDTEDLEKETRRRSLSNKKRNVRKDTKKTGK